MSMSRRKVISVAGQEAWRTGGDMEKDGFNVTPTTVTDSPVVMTRTDVSTRKESVNPKEISKSNEHFSAYRKILSSRKCSTCIKRT